MKLPWDKKYICWALTAFLTIAAAILFFMMLNNWEIVRGVLKLVFKSLRPITYGLIMAYLLNPLVNAIEHSVVYPLSKSVFKKRKRHIAPVSRGVSIFAAWCVTVILLFALTALVVPQLYSSIESLILQIPSHTERALRWGSSLLKENPEILEFLNKSLTGFSTNLTEIAKKIEEILPNINVVIVRLSSSLYDAAVLILNLLVGVIVSVYILKDKEKFAAQIKKLLYSTMSTERANKTIVLGRLTHDKFGNFITGKIFDSIIIGMLCFVILTIFNVPYSALVSVIVGVTNVIPFFGPFIGAIPSAILILFADPIKCLTFIVIIIILQQFDGNILGPKILGSTTGVSSFWVIFSILVGSGLFGVWGMVCAVPMFAVIYTLIKDGCSKSLRKKGIDYSSETFESIDHIDERTSAPIWFDREEG